MSKYSMVMQHETANPGVPTILYNGDRLDNAEGFARVRLHLGLTQAKMAEACGVSPATVKNWEQGRYEVSVAALNVLASLLRRD